MQKKYWGFLIYNGLLLAFLFPILVAPLIAQSNPEAFSLIHAAYAPTCHQLVERSLCYFENGAVADCIQPDSIWDSPKAQIVSLNGVLGYKFPVCSRDLAIYVAMLVGAFLFILLKGLSSRDVPPLIYFIIFLIPIALDGGTQLIGLRQSTNSLRLLTGFIAGVAVPFYVIPILNNFVLGPEKKDK
ncbi:DUF2085 domain-containing protein [Candidatus Micrarchaeota archaeon]|nr:DUF2085 domain-containing protein [Candidatus Micrarchaeota archaeon]